ncbi:heme/hemin ABC transporter substrate-binding protein [Bradyrhizobium sp. SYSU BS000235]|uniref:heme/hemin ABC transporter substrate-binding protein n=1 Tax=Bradyrhizobium sp. SYSU BS000235 TaxID=3411332 RepID=UPI003C782BD1
MLTRRLFAATFGLALFTGGALLASASAESIVIHDARGHDVTIGASSRIVSIGGAITEILYALGLEDRIVGIDTTSLYPPKALTEKPNVGYMRQLSAEGVLGLNPQLILAIEGSGPKETLDVLYSAKIPFVSFPETFTEDGLIEKIKLVAHAMDVDARGACLASAVASDLSQLRTLRENIKQPVRVMFVMSFLNGRAMVAGQKTAANQIIKMAGGLNAVEGFDGYKPINDEAIVAAKPDVILTMQRGREPVEAQTIFDNPSFAMTPAAVKKSFIAMDGLYLLGFGPRTASAARDLALSLYPDLATQAATWKPAVLSADCRK